MTSERKHNALHRSAALALMLSAAVPAGPAAADAEAIDIFIEDARLRDVVTLLATVADTRVTVSESLVGRVRKVRLNGTMGDGLDTLERQFDIDWFAFNDQVYVSHDSETVSRVVRLGNLTPQLARAALTETGLSSAALRVLDSRDGDSLVLSGPPQMVAFAEVIIENIPDPIVATPARCGITVWRAGEQQVASIGCGGPAPDAAEAAVQTDQGGAGS